MSNESLSLAITHLAQYIIQLNTELHEADDGPFSQFGTDIKDVRSTLSELELDRMVSNALLDMQVETSPPTDSTTQKAL